MNKKSLVIISGATAVGKTDLSLSLAKWVNGEIISADSMQVYKGLDIGTAKIRPEEMRGIRHYLIDELEPGDAFNVYEFQKRATVYIDDIIGRGKIPIIVGGTGFYIQSVLYGIEFTDQDTDMQYRKSLEELAAEQGPDVLHRMLAEVDPDAAVQIHANNVKRVIRALEFFHETQTPISRHNEEQRSRSSAYNYAYFVLNRDRAVIYDRINRRVDQMMEEGLVEEVRSLLDRGVNPSCLSMQGLGYKEIVSYLNGDISLEDATELLKKSTRHFAKRQLTWFRREKDVIWMNYEDYSSSIAIPEELPSCANERMLEKMIEILKEKEIVPLS